MADDESAPWAVTYAIWNRDAFVYETSHIQYAYSH